MVESDRGEALLSRRGTWCLVLMVYGSIFEGVDLLCQAISNMR